jgi:signal transduction histidine kinase/ligand-binding sensor domain-containing protein
MTRAWARLALTGAPADSSARKIIRTRTSFAPRPRNARRGAPPRLQHNVVGRELVPACHTRLSVTLRRLAAALLALSGAGALLLCASPVFAIEKEDLLTGYSVTTWNDGDGKPFGAVYAIVQDRHGYLWIGTDAGLFRFDGSRFTSSDDVNDRPLPKSAVTALHPGRDGSILVGFADDSALRRIRDGRVEILPRTNAPASVSDLIEDSTGGIWAVGDGVLYRFDGTAWQKVPLNAEGRDARVRQVSLRRDGRILAGTWLGTFERDEHTGRFERIAAHVSWGVTEDARGTLWTTDIADGFRRIDEPRSGRHSGAGYRVMFDRRGDLWVATYGAGLWRVTGAGTSDRAVYRAGLRTGLSSDLIQIVVEDRDGNIWVGTSGGLHRLTQRKLTPIEDLGYAIAVEPAASAGMWAGTTTGIVHFDRDGERWGPAVIVSPRPDVRSLYDDRRGTLWVGAIEGLFRFQAGRLSQVPLPPRGRPQITSISPAPDGALWLGDGAWLFRWDGSHLTPFAAVPGAPGRITYTERDRSGRLWVGFDSGRLGFLDSHGAFRLLGTRDGFDERAHDVIHGVYEDSDGNVWIGSSGGLGRFKDDRFTSISRRNALQGQVWSVVADSENRLWLSVDRGLVCLDRKEFDNAVAAPDYRVQYRLYDTLDGLAGGAFGHVSSAGAADGTLWFVQGGGLTSLNPAEIRDDPSSIAAPLYIESVLTSNERVASPAQRIAFPHGIGRLQINYTAVALSAANKIRFRYRLAGVDPDWVDAGAQRSAFYTNLSPGAYRFQVEASSEEGIWDTSKAEWSFDVRPAFYQTAWFYALCITAALAAIWCIWRLRMGIVKRQFSLVLAERVRVSRELHDTLLQSLVGVVLQLEPIAKTFVLEPVVARNQISRIRRQVEASIREARETIKNLRSPLLKVRDLATALEEFGQEAVAESGSSFSAVIEGSALLPPDIEGELFRIGQEAITNSARHAGAAHIQLLLNFGERAVTLRVSDDGCGFDLDPLAVSADHYGLTTMKERAEELHGELIITSSIGHGTVVETVVPMHLDVRRAISA